MLSLDVGCGTFKTAHQHGQVNIDITRKDKTVKVNNLCLADAHRLPFRDAVFDKVYMVEVIEHVNTPVDCLKEISRVLKPQGLVVVTTPNWLHYRTCLYALRGHVPDDDNPEHISVFMPCHFERLFSRVGLRLVKYDFVKVSGKTHHDGFDGFFAKVLPRVVGGYNTVVVGRKQ